MNKKAVLLLALCLLLSGCVPLSVDLQPMEQSYELNVSPGETAAPAVGDQIGEWQYTGALYYPDAAAQELIEVYGTVTVSGGRTLAQALIEALLTGPSSPNARAVAPKGTTLLSVRQSGHVAVVDLSIDALNVESDQQLLWMQAAIANTLSGVDGIDYVDMLIAGRAQSPISLPLGALARTEANIASLWAKVAAEEELAQTATAPIERVAAVYYAARDGYFVVPTARTLTVQNGDFLGALLGALGETHALDPALKAALPGAETRLITDARIVRLDDGRQVARLTFDANFAAILEKNNLNAWQMYAALTSTITGFLPEIDGLQVYIGDGQLARAESPAGEVVFEGGVMTRALFEPTICRLRSIYLTATDGSLRTLSRPMASEDAVSLRMLIGELFGEPKAWEKDVLRVMPDGLSADDLLGIRVENGEAVINFSDYFYAGCQRLSEQQERNLVYALVNTLTNMPFIDAVRIQIEGEPVDALVHSICLIGPLVRNPGLISAPPSETPG